MLQLDIPPNVAKAFIAGTVAFLRRLYKVSQAQPKVSQHTARRQSFVISCKLGASCARVEEKVGTHLSQRRKVML
jgi:hypothetical protein